MKSNNITDATVYTSYAAEAWTTALNILATEFYIKTYDDEKYSYYCNLLNSLTDGELEILHCWISINNHITSLGHMCSHGDYDSVKDSLFDFLDERSNKDEQRT